MLIVQSTLGPGLCWNKRWVTGVARDRRMVYTAWIASIRIALLHGNEV